MGTLLCPLYLSTPIKRNFWGLKRYVFEMESFFIELRVGRKKKDVPAIKIGDIIVIFVGKIIKKALIYDEDWNIFSLNESINLIINEIKKSHLKADIFTFAQKIPNVRPYFKYHNEWDNVAAIPITSYQDWLSSLSSDARKDLKRAERMGVITKTVDFSDELVSEIIKIHNESPIRQGRYFVHYGKDFDTVKKEYATYPDRSEFIVAYHNNELIGLIKIVYVGELACIMEILSKISHYDKRPTNALIAKAVEICSNKQILYLTYGKYYYGNKKRDSVVDFKKRVGFIKILYPRYYIPLTLKGRIAIFFGFHRDLLDLAPSFLIYLYRILRSMIIKKKYSQIIKRK